jgi:two-component system, NtrC family, C4-dicarboxylate transport sensor histidine kinase DctB
MPYSSHSIMPELPSGGIPASVFDDLQAGVGLQLLGDITLDPQAGIIGYRITGLRGAAAAGVLVVHPSDLDAVIATFQAPVAEPAAAAMLPGVSPGVITAEFRNVADGRLSDWCVLIMRDRAGAGFARGTLCRFGRTQAAADLALQHARLAEMGSMSVAMTHEMRQPLFTIGLAAESGALALEGVQHPGAVRARQKFDRIGVQIDRLRQIMPAIAAYSRIDAVPDEPFDVHEVVGTAVAYMTPVARHADVALVLRAGLPGIGLVRMRRVQLQQVLVNLIQNALDAICAVPAEAASATGFGNEADTRRGDAGSHGLVTVEVDQQGDAIVIVVTDDGAGMPGAVQKVAFAPFFTTKDRRAGTGLGLYVCQQIMKSAGGSIDLAPGAARGCVATVRVPVAAASADG